MSLLSGSISSNAVASFHSVVDSPPGIDQPVDGLDLGEAPHGLSVRAGLFERQDMLADVTLQSEYTNDRQAGFPLGVHTARRRGTRHRYRLQRINE